MKYLKNGIKSIKTITIDFDDDSSSQIQSNIQKPSPSPITIQLRHHQITKYSQITPIRRIPPPTHPQKPLPSKKIQFIEVSDQQLQIINQPPSNKLQDIGAKCFKKKLMKATNKCKMQGKLYSSSQCSICLTSLQLKDHQQIGRLPCQHSFCYDCIVHSSKFCTRCPYCRAPFKFINKNFQIIHVQQKQQQQNFDPYDQPCYVCGRNDDFDHLLECQYCQSAFCHTYCDNRLESDVPPQQSWYCLSCSNLVNTSL